MNIKTLLTEEIENELKELRKIKLGGDEYKTTVGGVAQLTDRLIELKRVDSENADKIEAREIEVELKQQELADERKDRLIKNCISVGGIVLPIIACIWGTQKSFEFEKDGSITTIMGRGFIQKLLPNKK